MTWILLIIIGVLLVYIFFFHHEMHLLHRQIQDKLTHQSKVRILKKHPLLQMNMLIEDYNHIFDELLVTQQAYKEERQMLDRTIHNISHDIRTPLTVSWGYTKQLLKESPDNPILHKIDQSLDHVSKRLEHLLEYQNLLENNIQAHNQPVNISQVLSQALIKFYDLYTQMHFNVDIHIGENLWIKCDEDLLDRILHNLLGNAAKHGKDNICIELSQQGRYVQLLISNTVKQDIKHLHKLTDRFYAEDLSSSERSSGLGLYITDHLVQMTNGNLELTYEAPLYSALVTWTAIKLEK